MPVPKKSRARKSKGKSKAQPASLLAAGRSRRTLTSDAAGMGRHSIEPSQPFFLIHHPRSWRLATQGLDGPTLVPDLQRREVQPGVNGMRTRQPHEPEEATYQAALESDVRNGWTVLYPDEEVPSSCLPDGIEEEGYLREYPCRGPISQRTGSHYVEVWSVPVATYPGEQQRYSFDRAAYNRWLVHLVESGRIEGPSARVRAELATRASSRVARVKAAPLPPDLRKDRVVEQQARLAAIEGAALPEEVQA